MRICVLLWGVILAAVLLSGMVSALTLNPSANEAPALNQPGPGLTGAIFAPTVGVSTSISETGPVLPLKGAIITGKVFLGPPGPDEQPLTGVSLELFCSSVATSPGVTDGVVKTNASGYYSFDVSDQCNFYTIVLYSGGAIIHAESDSGVVIEGNRIRLASPPTGTVSGGNNFWVAATAPGPTSAGPGSPGLDVVTGAVIVIGVGIIAIFLALLLRRRKGGDSCG